MADDLTLWFFGVVAILCFVGIAYALFGPRG